MEQFYCSKENKDFEDEMFGLGMIPTNLLDSALEILMLLEVIEWKWDINTLLEQPADLLKAVLHLKLIGEKLKSQSKQN